jgi:hypothetical protein
MSASEQHVHDRERGAVEVLYTIHRDPAASVRRSSSFEADIKRAMKQFEHTYLGVRAESRASIVEGSNCAVALLVSGGFGSEHLDTIWSRQLAWFGLAARRASVEAELKANAAPAGQAAGSIRLSAD